jgi:hypothetical protein
VYTLHCIGKERIQQQQHQDHNAFFWERAKRAEETVMMKEKTPKTLAGL